MRIIVVMAALAISLGLSTVGEVWGTAIGQPIQVERVPPICYDE